MGAGEACARQFSTRFESRPRSRAESADSCQPIPPDADRVLRPETGAGVRPGPKYDSSDGEPTAQFAEIRSSSTRNRGTTLPASRCADRIGKVHLDVRVRD